MIEMKLNTAATIHTVRLDPVDIISYQKSREFSHSSLVTQQIDLGRTLLGKFHKNTTITEVDIEVELIEADFGGDLASRQIQRPCRLHKLVHGVSGTVDHLLPCTPSSPLDLHKGKNLLCGISPRVQFQSHPCPNANTEQNIQHDYENRCKRQR